EGPYRLDQGDRQPNPNGRGATRAARRASYTPSRSSHCGVGETPAGAALKTFAGNRAHRGALERKGSGMLTTMAKLLKNDTGATAIEYGLIAALISVAAVTVLTAAARHLTSPFSTVARK